MTVLNWRRSSRCADDTCVEVAFDGDRVLVRSSKHPDGGVIEYTRGEWLDVLAEVAANGAPAHAWRPFSDDDWCWGREDHDLDEWLRFTPAEMDAFVADALAGNFDLKPRVVIYGNPCCGGNGVEASCEVCRG